ncbi:MAG: hypothetical protein L6Q54_09815 [Leptospiraceae bacterium]|nr:hypothetical protein [Leptospiraceae bacterium]MCK6381522.1 hypothetical protein [Leptospiraceae bacterium]NUM40661.1 hypothetical protein [Leptospiraceae bacterium]
MQILKEKNINKDSTVLCMCAGCGKNVEKVYQNNLCKTCLTGIFKRLVTVIDSVRHTNSI